MLLTLLCGLFSACAGEAVWPETGNITDVILGENRSMADETSGEAPGEDDEDVFAEYEALFASLKGSYAFDTLSRAEQYWYADIYRILSDRLEVGELFQSQIGVLDTGDVDKLFRCVMNDHPELFYVSGYSQIEHSRNEEVYRIEFEGSYTMDAAEIAIRQEQIALYAEECLAGISPEATDYEKVKYIYEYIIRHTEYRMDAPQNQNICSVFISRESVCQGYAKAMQYLLQELGVPCTLVIGEVEGVGHAWNLVRLEGQYYYVDPTWGDASYRSSSGEDRQHYPAVNYDYLCVTTEQLCKTHKIDNVVEMPVCRATEANYYIREGAYFAVYDEETMGNFLAAARERGEDAVTVKCGDEAVYRQFCREFIDRQYIFRYLDVEDGVLAYIDNSDQFSLTFWLTEQ